MRQLFTRWSSRPEGATTTSLGQSGSGGHAGIRAALGTRTNKEASPERADQTQPNRGIRCKNRGWTAAYKNSIPVAPLQGFLFDVSVTQGGAARLSPLRSALGYSVWPLQGRMLGAS